MNPSEGLSALRRANPRSAPAFPDSVAAAAAAVRAQLGTAGAPVRRGRRAPVVFVAAALTAAATAAALLTFASPGGRGIESAVAAVKQAATLTAASAERSGTAVVRLTHRGAVWAGSTIRWHGDDLAVSRAVPARRPGSELRVVGGVMYGIEPEEGGWVVLGPPDSIDPRSGTTPAQYLAAVREDVGGATLRRIVDGMTELTTRRLADGSTVYSGAVPAGLIARESGFKEGQAIRVLPFGYVAHDQAADPDALLDVAVTVSAVGIVREIAVQWGEWSYTVTYIGLGSTAAPTVPADAKPLRRP